jgi:flavin-dependent dehydrogenase
MEQLVDVAVVGGGFAGLACARAAAARGLRALVIDRRPAPGASPHTTGILVKEVADAWDVPAVLTRTITAVRLHAPGGRTLELCAPGYYFLATDTSGLLRFLASQTEALGAELRYGEAFRGSDPTASGHRLRGVDVVARHVVGADGPRSAVASWFGLGRNRAFLVGAEAEFVGVRGLEDDHLHCFIDSDLAPGYIGWIVPGCGITQVGLAARAPARPRLRAMLERAARIADFRAARIVGRRGGVIPVGGPVRPSSAPGVLLVGDAAGHVSPLTAGGIHTALDLGRRAGLAIADHLLAGGPDPAVALHAATPCFRTKRCLRWVVERRPPSWAINALVASRLFRALAQTVFFHHRGLLSRAAWRDLVAALAGTAPGGEAR